MKHVRAAVATLVVLVAAVVRVSVATDQLFFKDGNRQMNVYAAVGEDVVLECEAGGSPSPTIHWLHDGRRLQQVAITYVVVRAGAYTTFTNYDI